MTKGYLITEQQVQQILSALEEIPTTKGYIIMHELIRCKKQQPIVIKDKEDARKENN